MSNPIDPNAFNEPTPIPMRLVCEQCGTLHIDEGEFATKPHHTHTCQKCGANWRPAKVPTVGVRFLPGYQNEPRRPLVYLESPFAGDRVRNAAYLKDAMLDSLRRGEAPFASHALYTQFLDDDIPDERALGIEAGLAWGDTAELTVVYIDLGISRGMQLGIDRAWRAKRPIEERRLPNWDRR